ncbi:MAG: NapC/NirT family cytochrome c [Bryobacterales bacterium]|nr:NapC/NirT family cytochrome c [Bryobacterales bacterium]
MNGETRSSWRGWLSPLVHLSNNWISFIGVALVTGASVFWFFLLPTLMRGEVENPYSGILLFLVLPGVFITGLLLIPLGIYVLRRRERGRAAPLPPLDWRNADLRRLVWFVIGATLVNGVIASQLTYSAVGYMDSVTFCGLTCHQVMSPEYTAYQNSPHARVECVKCHIGPGASWFVRSKLSGVGQVFAVALNTYPRPIPAPVENLRPARETCEACHWPQKYGGDRLRVVSHFAEDEKNTRTKSVLMMHIGGGNGGPGIHGFHVAQGIVVEYAPADEKRQVIPWVRYRDASGKVTEYFAEGARPEDVRKLPVRVMDCVDCHNRPTHVFEVPERAVDEAIAAGEISAGLPFVKKTAVELLKKSYGSREEAAKTIPAAFQSFYKERYPQAADGNGAAVGRSAQSVLAIYSRNIFPQMNVTWGTYPNNIGHTDFPGCFRCHDDQHASRDGRKISQDCNSCHNLLAMEEESPKVLGELGLQ